MKEKSTTGRHAAPPAPKPEPEKTEHRPAAPDGHRRRNYVLLGLGLVLVLLLIVGFLGRGAAGEKRAREQLRRGEACFAAGDYDDALGYFLQAAEKEATDELRARLADCYIALGRQEQAEGNVDGAMADYDGALEMLRAISAQDESVHAQIESLENEKQLLRREGKLQIAGSDYDRSLNTLIIGGTALTAGDLARVAELYSLASLSLTEDGLEDLSFLSGLGGLTSLDLSGNRIADLSPLASLQGLRTLVLDGNPVVDFSPLYGLRELSTLSIHGVEISEAQLAELSQALPGCSIHSESAQSEAHELTTRVTR